MAAIADGRLASSITMSTKSSTNNRRLPRVWSNPQLSSHLRPGLEAPVLQQTHVADASYELDVTRGLAIKTSRDGSPVTPERRQSMPDIGYVKVSPWARTIKNITQYSLP
jgi:hypothetical protein